MNKQRFARLISFAFHPIVFALLVPFLLIYRQTKSIFFGIQWSLLSLFFLLILITSFSILRPKASILDLDISQKNQRNLFYTLAMCTGVLYALFIIFFKGVHFLLIVPTLGTIAGIIFFVGFNRFMKISIHTAVVCAFVVTFGALYGLQLLIWIIWMVPLIMWARIELDKHLKNELLAGVFVGSIIPIITIVLRKIFFL